LRQLLSHAGLTVVGEADAIPAAIKLARNLTPDIAVVDVMLPGESGVEGTPQLKASAPNMRVILVSAHHDSAQVLKKSAEKAGAEAFIAKDDLDLDVVRKWTKKLESKS